MSSLTIYGASAFDRVKNVVNATSEFIDLHAPQVVKYGTLGLFSALPVTLIYGVNPLACAVLVATAATVYDFIKDKIEFLNQKSPEVQLAGKSLISSLSAYAIIFMLRLSITVPQALVVGTITFTAYKVYEKGLDFFKEKSQD